MLYGSVDMANIECFEKKAIRLLCADIVHRSTLELVLNSPESVQVKYTGCEYLLEISHSELPDSRLLLESPKVIGEFQGHKVSFVVYIENRLLCLECSNYSNFGVPSEIRSGSINVSAI